MKHLIPFPLFILSLVLTGCSGQTEETDKGKPIELKKVEVSKTHAGPYPIRTVCTTGMVADLVRKVGGDRVVVEALMGSDVDPHLYRANTGDIEKLNRADLIFFNGLHLEGKMGDTLGRLGKKITSCGIGEYLEPARLLSEGETADPHIWFDVSLWSEAAGVVLDVLVKYDPANADEYRGRADSYRKQLAGLHAEVKEKIASIPKSKRLLITSHDAFRYFGKAYDIEVRGVQGISTEGEASLKDVEDLVNLIVERQVKAVFIETSVSSRNIESIVEGCRAKGHKVVLGGELFSDAMGREGSAEGTYVGMIRHNVHVIESSLNR